MFQDPYDVAAFVLGMRDVDLGGFPASTHSDDGGGKLDPSLLKTFGPVDQRGSEVNDPSTTKRTVAGWVVHVGDRKVKTNGKYRLQVEYNA